MLNKELLLTGKEKLFTHIVIPAVTGDDYRGTFYGFSGSKGSCSPLTWSKEGWASAKIVSLTNLVGDMTVGSTTLVFGSVQNNPTPVTLYLCRLDKNIQLSKSFSANQFTMNTTWYNKELFNYNDVGKEIPIWLSLTPPPSNTKVF